MWFITSHHRVVHAATPPSHPFTIYTTLKTQTHKWRTHLSGHILPILLCTQYKSSICLWHQYIVAAIFPLDKLLFTFYTHTLVTMHCIVPFLWSWYCIINTICFLRLVLILTHTGIERLELSYNWTTPGVACAKCKREMKKQVCEMTSSRGYCACTLMSLSVIMSIRTLRKPIGPIRCPLCLVAEYQMGQTSQLRGNLVGTFAISQANCFVPTTWAGTSLPPAPSIKHQQSKGKKNFVINHYGIQSHSGCTVGVSLITSFDFASPYV